MIEFKKKRRKTIQKTFLIFLKSRKGKKKAREGKEKSNQNFSWTFFKVKKKKQKSIYFNAFIYERYGKAMDFAEYKRERLLKECKSMIIETVLSRSDKLDLLKKRINISLGFFITMSAH